MKLRIIALTLAVFILTMAAAGCDAAGTSPVSADADGIVTIVSIFPGEPPARMEAVLGAINEKMSADIGVNLALTWQPWGEYYNKIKLDVAAGEPIDFIWMGSADLSELHNSRLIAPIDSLMAQHGSNIYANIDEMFFPSMMIGGQLLGIPSTANAPITMTGHSALYREDLRLKHDLPIPECLETIEAYLQGIADNEPDLSPLMSSSFGWSMLPLHGDEGFLGGTGGSTAVRVNHDMSVDVMPIHEAQAWLGTGAQMREWYLKGFVPSDILNMTPGPNFMNGMGAMMNGSAMSAVERQAEIAANVPGALLGGTKLHGDRLKIMGGNGGNALYLSSTSRNPEAVVKFWDWVWTSQENYDLYCYGILGEDYELTENGRITVLSDYGNFPNWMFNNMNYLRFGVDTTDEFIETIKAWDDGAVISPLFGFSFDPSNVSTELSMFGAVWAAYSASFDSGAGDRDVILPAFIAEATAAGQGAIVEEARRQVEEFLANK
ncbi:MAG: ABC transporter substrate-binding protein [Defluviitaleaceae bacterium]|nr:ABC transporter substrate-binding protein [Defluviitaleaceae bacterium]